ncbi:MAG: uracil-DNA glycosylase [Thermoleophilia bacterium]|nr:uracil-DNA glycosylase [Thermoleophilia bacterium]
MHPRESTGTGGRVRAGDIDTIADLELTASGCELCRLSRDRRMVVRGSGPADAAVLVVAEAPGYHEDREGRLLAGRTGECFDGLLADAGLTRDEVFLTSVVKCRPPTGRTPFPDEVEACEGWLFRELDLVRPRVVLTLGALALRLVTGRQERLADVHGTMLHAQVRGRDVVVWPMLHPGAAVHVPGLLDSLRADARGLGRLLQGARAEPGAPRAVAGSTAPDPAPVPTPVPTPLPAAAPDSGDDDEPQLSLGF